MSFSLRFDSCQKRILFSGVHRVQRLHEPRDPHVATLNVAEEKRDVSQQCFQRAA